MGLRIRNKRNIGLPFLWAGLSATLIAGNAHASFTDLQDVPWYGGTDHYSGDSLIARGIFRNSVKRIATFDSLPANTGPLPAWGGDHKGDFWYGVAVMAKGDTGIVIHNDSGAVLQSIVTGSGEGQAAGILALQDATVANSGSVDAQYLNHAGWAAGVGLKGPGTVDNNAGAAISATANYAVGLSGNGGRLKIINDGTITAKGIAGQSAALRNRAYGVDLFSYSGNHDAPIYFENNGAVAATADMANTDSANARGVNIWAEGSSATFKNAGSIQATAEGPNGTADGVYCGADNGDVSFTNSGSITQTGAAGGFCVGVENDSDTDNVSIDNSGTITTDNPFAIMLGNYKTGLKTCGHCSFRNTGTIKGGWLGLSWPAIGGMTFFDSGDIRTGQCWLGGNVDATIAGLPTIDPELTPADGNNTLVFKLDGTLEKINGTAASGTTLANLPSQGSIVVSGKTYRWKNFTSVSGTVFPGNAGMDGDGPGRGFSFACKARMASVFLPAKTPSLTLKTYDARGLLVSLVSKRNLPAGPSSFPIASRLSPGHYLCEISWGRGKHASATIDVR